MADLANCSRCGKVFVKVSAHICPSCVQDIEQEYIRCAEYLRENRQVNIYELSEATEVTVRQITKFIREGRISIVDMPNLGYPCEVCGTPIREGKFCKDCADRLHKNLKSALDEKPKEEEKSNIYYQIKDRFNS